MSPLATMICAWAGLYAYLCAYYMVLHARRRAEREYLAFGLLSGSMAIYAVGTALQTDATSIAEAATWERLQCFGLLPATAFYTDFAHQVAGRTRASAPKLAYIFGGLGVLANMAGLFLDPSSPMPPDTFLLTPAAPAILTAELLPVGSLMMVGALLFLVYATSILSARARYDPDVRIVFGGGLLICLVGFHDAVLRVTPVRSLYLLQHAYLLFALAVSYVLLGRFVRTASALTSRTLELKRSYNELRNAQVQLVRKEQLATMGELSAVIAHEVRNPLAIIKNAVSGLHRPTLRDADRKVLLGILDEEADRLNRLVGDLLAYARPVTPQASTIDVATMVRGAVDLARTAAARGDEVSYDMQMASETLTVQGDIDLLRQALVNVADNALQAMPDSGTLTVRTYETTLEGNPAVAIAFRDTGEGMDTLVRAKASDPFFTTRPTGTGLGLAIVHRLITSHGGKVQIESSYGSGTTVILILPVRATTSAPFEPDQELMEDDAHPLPDSSEPAPHTG